MKILYPVLALLLLLPFIMASCDSTATGETQKTTTTTITSSPVTTTIAETIPPITTSPVSTTPDTTPSSTPERVINNITPAEAYTLIQDNADNPDFIIIDVRTPDEYAQGHLENATVIDYRSENFTIEISKLDRFKKYLIYCRTGGRSAGARDQMAALGFKDISNILGGITDWINQGFSVIK